MTKDYIKEIITSYSPETAALMIAHAWNEGRLSEEQEEREAWDKYLCSTKNISYHPVEFANMMLAERRKRFGK